MNEQIQKMANDYYEAMLEVRATICSMNEGAPKWYAKKLYEKGWRKQNEGEWIFKEYGEDTYTNLTRIYECSLCGRTIECLNEADEPYCHCGAKMKGGAE